MTEYSLYCGNFDCLSRQEDPPRLFVVPEDELPDGEVWLCERCRDG